ncbi:hypothetical protein DV515_00006937, partial [Chloebia gouldiae]
GPGRRGPGNDTGLSRRGGSPGRGLREHPPPPPPPACHPRDRRNSGRTLLAKLTNRAHHSAGVAHSVRGDGAGTERGASLILRGGWEEMEEKRRKYSISSDNSDTTDSK